MISDESGSNNNKGQIEPPDAAEVNFKSKAVINEITTKVEASTITQTVSSQNTLTHLTSIKEKASKVVQEGFETTRLSENRTSAEKRKTVEKESDPKETHVVSRTDGTVQNTTHKFSKPDSEHKRDKPGSKTNSLNQVTASVGTRDAANRIDEEQIPVDAASDLDESAGEENLCITNLQRKQKLLEKTALAKSRIQKKSISPPITKPKHASLEVKFENVPKNILGIRPLEKSDKKEVSDKNENVQANIVRTLQEQQHVINQCKNAINDLPKNPDENLVRMVKTKSNSNTETGQILPSLESIINVNRRHCDISVLADSRNESDSISTVSTELAKVQSLTESNKMCQTEYEITPKKKSSKVKANASKVNHVSNARKAAPKIKNKPLQSYEQQKPGENLGNNVSTTAVSRPLLKNVNPKALLSETDKTISSGSIMTSNLYFQPFSSIGNREPHVKSINEMNDFDDDNNEDEDSGGDTVNTRKNITTAFKNIPFPGRRKESNVDMEKRVLELLPKDISSKVRYILSVHRSWTDRTTKHTLTCPYCKNELVNPVFFMRHLERHVKCEFDCPNCGKQFANKRNLNSHRFKVVKGTLNCEMCNFQAPNACLLRKHKDKEHSRTSEAYQCHLCAKMVKSKTYLTVHLKTVHDITEGKYECGICGLKSTRPKWLAKHMKAHQQNNLPLTCDICSKTFKHRKNLMSHFLTVHREKGNHCKECGKSFGSSTKLRVHERTHTGVKPFACDICDYKTSQNSNLKQHMKSHDRDVKTRKTSKLKESTVTVNPAGRNIVPIAPVTLQNKKLGQKLPRETQGTAVDTQQSNIQNEPPTNTPLPNYQEQNVGSTALPSQSFMQNTAYDERVINKDFYNTGIDSTGYDANILSKDPYQSSYVNPEDAFMNATDYENSVNALHDMQQYASTLYGNEPTAESSEEEDDDEDDDTSGSDNLEDSYEKESDEECPMTFQELLGRDDTLPSKDAVQNPGSYTENPFSEKQTFELTSALHALHPEMQNVPNSAALYDSSQLHQYTDNMEYQQALNYDMQSADTDTGPLMNIHKYAQGFEELLRGASYDVNASNSQDMTHQQNAYNQTAVKGGNSDQYMQYDSAPDKMTDKDWNMYNIPNGDPSNKEGLSSFYQAFQGMSYNNYNSYYGDGSNNMAYQAGTSTQPDSSNLAYQAGNQMNEMTDPQYAYDNTYSGIAQDAAGYQMPKTGSTHLPATQMNYDGNMGYQSMESMVGHSYHPQMNPAEYEQMMQQGSTMDPSAAVNQSYMDLQAPISYLDQMHTES